MPDGSRIPILIFTNAGGRYSCNHHSGSPGQGMSGWVVQWSGRRLAFKSQLPLPLTHQPWDMALIFSSLCLSFLICKRSSRPTEWLWVTTQTKSSCPGRTARRACYNGGTQPHIVMARPALESQAVQCRNPSSLVLKKERKG